MQKYTRHSIVSIDEVLTVIRNTAQNFKDKTRTEINGTPVGTTSLRLRTFAVHGTKCSACGLDASYFAIERCESRDKNIPFHLNLYGVRNGTEILFTHDHKLARSLGGKDHLSNTQTMCTICNSIKSIEETKLTMTKKK